jgi:hypothetical protein
VSLESFLLEDEDMFVTICTGIAYRLKDYFTDQIALAQYLIVSAKAAEKNIIFSEDAEITDDAKIIDNHDAN